MESCCPTLVGFPMGSRGSLGSFCPTLVGFPMGSRGSLGDLLPHTYGVCCGLMGVCWRCSAPHLWGSIWAHGGHLGTFCPTLMGFAMGSWGSLGELLPHTCGAPCGLTGASWGPSAPHLWLCRGLMCATRAPPAPHLWGSPWAHRGHSGTFLPHSSALRCAFTGSHSGTPRPTLMGPIAAPPPVLPPPLCGRPHAVTRRHPRPAGWDSPPLLRPPI